MSITVALFDVDGTLTWEHTWKAYMATFRHHRLRRWAHWRFLVAHYPLYLLRRLGGISEERFRTAWAGHLAWYVAGLTVAEAEALWQWGAEQALRPSLREDTLALLERHRRAGERIVLVSSAPEPFLRHIGRLVGADAVVGTRFVVQQGRYTGAYLPPVCIGRHKATLTRQHLTTLGWEVDWASSVAYADSITDLDLLEMVGRPTVVYPDPELEAVAQERGWPRFPG